MTTSRITISLPTQTLEKAERERQSTGETRSELFRRALDVLFEAQRREAAIRAYVEGYVFEPETPYEVEATARMAGFVFEGDDWSGSDSEPTD